MSNFKSNLQQGEVIDNSKLREIFKCSPQGGMRRSLSTNTLVIVSDHVKSVYDDRWIGDEFHYTGMGLTGNQRLDSSQNKTLAQSDQNGVEVHLFEIFKSKEYTYQGTVALVGQPYEEQQTDKKGENRTVWMFPIKLVDGNPMPVSDDIIREIFRRKEQIARNLPIDELEKRAKSASPKTGSRTTITSTYSRSSWISYYVKKLANGECDLCDSPAPFLDSKNMAYLESHHIEWLSKGGEDTIGNTVALCPNCHRKMHILDREIDKKKLRLKASARS